MENEIDIFPRSLTTIEDIIRDTNVIDFGNNNVYNIGDSNIPPDGLGQQVLAKASDDSFDLYWKTLNASPDEISRQTIEIVSTGVGVAYYASTLPKSINFLRILGIANGYDAAITITPGENIYYDQLLIIHAKNLDSIATVNSSTPFNINGVDSNSIVFEADNFAVFLKNGNNWKLVASDFLGSVGAGADGLSAYEIAVNNGFVGNEAAWLASLEGADGATGATGSQGIQGIQGIQGVAGTNGADGSKIYQGAGVPSNGSYLVTDWYINTSNSDVYEKTGASTWTLRLNIKGATGNTGATGSTGAQGIQGIQGIQGATGATGSTGAAGANGTDGVDGTDGVGVPTGGTAGQVLSKINGTDYNTQWVDPSGGTSFTYTTLADADTTLAVNTIYKLGATTLTANRTLAMPSGTDGDEIGVWNVNTTDFDISVDGGNDVYYWDEITILTTLDTAVYYKFKFIFGNWIVQNLT